MKTLLSYVPVTLLILAFLSRPTHAQDSSVPLEQRSVRASFIHPALACQAPSITLAPSLKAASNSALAEYKDWTVTLRLPNDGYSREISFKIHVGETGQVQFIEERRLQSGITENPHPHGDTRVAEALRSAFHLFQPVQIKSEKEGLPALHLLEPATFGVCRAESHKFSPAPKSVSEAISPKEPLQIEFKSPLGESKTYSMEGSLIGRLMPQPMKDFSKRMALDDESSQQVCIFQANQATEDSPAKLELILNKVNPQAHPELSAALKSYQNLRDFMKESLSDQTDSSRGLNRERSGLFTLDSASPSSATQPKLDLVALLTDEQKQFTEKQLLTISTNASLSAGSFSLETTDSKDVLEISESSIPVVLYLIKSESGPDGVEKIVYQQIDIEKPSALISPSGKKMNVIVRPKSALEANQNYMVILGRRINGEIRDLAPTYFRTKDVKSTR